MNPRLIATLLNIAEEARAYPQLKHLVDESLRALELEHVSSLEMITPVLIVNDEKAEAEPPHNDRAVSATRRNS